MIARECICRYVMVSKSILILGDNTVAGLSSSKFSHTMVLPCLTKSAEIIVLASIVVSFVSKESNRAHAYWALFFLGGARSTDSQIRRS